MEIRLKEGFEKSYKFTNKKYSKMLYNDEEKEIKLEVEALYKVYTSATLVALCDPAKIPISWRPWPWRSRCAGTSWD